jgi:hypothetical protein
VIKRLFCNLISVVGEWIKGHNLVRPQIGTHDLRLLVAARPLTTVAPWGSGGFAGVAKLGLQHIDRRGSYRKMSGCSRQAYPVLLVGSNVFARDSRCDESSSLSRVSVQKLQGPYGDQKGMGCGGRSS